MSWLVTHGVFTSHKGLEYFSWVMLHCPQVVQTISREKVWLHMAYCPEVECQCASRFARFVEVMENSLPE